MDTNNNDNNINNENKTNIETNNEVTRSESHSVSDNHEHNKKSKLSSKHKKILIIGIIVLCLLVIGLVVVVLFTGKDKNTRNKKTKKIVVESTMTEKEYKAIVDAYGDAVTLASNNYMTLKNGEIPSFNDIKDSIARKVVEKEYLINYECKSLKVDFLLNIGTLEYKRYSLKNRINKTKRKIELLKDIEYYEINEINNRNYFVSSYEGNSNNTTLVDTYECYNKKCEGYNYSEIINKAIIHDGDYYLYDFSTKEKSKLNIEGNDYSNINFVENENKTLGLFIYKNNQGYAFYNLDSNTVVTEYIYGEMYSLASISSVLATKGENTVLINPNNGSVERTINGLLHISEVHVNGNIYYQAYPYSEGPNYSRIVLNSNLDRIINDNYDVGVFNSDSTITVSKLNDNHVYTYDLSGNLIYTSKEYKQVLKVLKDFAVVLTNDSDLVLLNRSDEVLTTFLKVTDKHYLHPLISGWYTTNGKNGIYFVVGDNDIPYGTEGSGLEYYYIPSTGETGVIKTKGVGGYAKPILYLYPTKKTKVEVSFSNPEVLTTTYPKFDKSWVVTANKNGDLYDSKGKYYYGLYWEEEGSTNIDFSEGFYVDKDSAIEFLEDKLTTIGLNAKERNEFIMYWLPILEKNEHNLVYFELTKERDKFNKLNITPKPDSLLRVAIHVKKVDGPIFIKEEKLETFKRKGFVAVEWGGVIH